MASDIRIRTILIVRKEREREMFYLTTHSTHFIYGYMASDIWLKTILIVRKETRCRHIGYSFRLAARILLYAPSLRQDSTYHGLCYTSRGALAGTRNSSMGPPHEGSIRRPIAPWANALTTELHLAPLPVLVSCNIQTYTHRTLSPCWPRSAGLGGFLKDADEQVLETNKLVNEPAKWIDWRVDKEGRKEGNVLFNDALNTFYLRLYYGVGHMVKDHSDSERERERKCFI